MTDPQHLSATDILQPVHDGTHKTTITPNWMQGRATFGGLTVAIAVEDMLHALPDPRPLKSLMVSFVAPIGEGTVEAKSELLRAGKSVAQTQTTLSQNDGKPALVVLGAFGHDRDTKKVMSDVPFAPKPLADTHPMPTRTTGLPAFLQNFDIRWIKAIPTAATNDRELAMWVRHTAGDGMSPLARLVAVADIPPPIMMAHYDRPIMASSLSWSLELLVDEDQMAGDWFYLDYQLEQAEGGYQVQNGRIYAEDGTLLALSRQCMVYFE